MSIYFCDFFAQILGVFFVEIAQRIKELCDKHNISGVELGKLLGLSKSPMTDWKNGKAKPTLDQITIICEYFAISTDYLIKGQFQLLSDITDDETELLALYRKLEPIKQAEYRAELKGYIRAKEENSK
jgi:transcriptional regulator with XRE-family HTH domain